MPNNLWPWISRYAIPAESQLNEPGGNDRFWNCVFSCVSVALQVLGYPDLEPEDMRQLVQPGSHAGASFDTVANYLRAHPERWPNLPRIDTYNPSDTLAAFDQLLAKGYLTIFDVYDDGNGNVLNHSVPQGYTHAVLLEAQGPTNTTLWNPWLGEQAGQTFDRAFIKAATMGSTGNLMVFAQDIRVSAPTPAGNPGPTQTEEKLTMLIRESNAVGPDGNPRVYVVDASGKRHLSGAEFSAWEANGAKPVDMKAEDIAGIPWAAGI